MKILIANDGSVFGDKAVVFAANIIGGEGETEVKIITVIEPAAATGVELLIESVEELTKPENPEAILATEIVKRSETVLRERCPGKNLNISREVLAGLAARTIVEKADDWQADLIIVGTHGHGFWKRTWLGSVSDRVAHHAACSVLIVRDEK